MLTHSIANQPTHLAKVVLNYPCVIRAMDATRTGMGSVLFASSKHPMLWHMTFPEDIQQCIMTTDNPGGDLTNSDLEQTGVLAQANITNNLYDLHDHTLSTLNDNIAAGSHSHKGALTSDQAGTYIC